jgi:hypothetical protein
MTQIKCFINRHSYSNYYKYIFIPFSTLMHNTQMYPGTRACICMYTKKIVIRNFHNILKLTHYVRFEFACEHPLQFAHKYLHDSEKSFLGFQVNKYNLFCSKLWIRIPLQIIRNGNPAETKTNNSLTCCMCPPRSVPQRGTCQPAMCRECSPVTIHLPRSCIPPAL